MDAESRGLFKDKGGARGANEVQMPALRTDDAYSWNVKRSQHRISFMSKPKAKTPHRYSFSFENRRSGREQNIEVYNFDWRSALSYALTEIAINTKTSRSQWRMTEMRETG